MNKLEDIAKMMNKYDDRILVVHNMLSDKEYALLLNVYTGKANNNSWNYEGFKKVADYLRQLNREYTEVISVESLAKRIIAEQYGNDVRFSYEEQVKKVQGIISARYGHHLFLSHSYAAGVKGGVLAQLRTLHGRTHYGEGERTVSRSIERTMQQCCSCPRFGNCPFDRCDARFYLKHGAPSVEVLTMDGQYRLLCDVSLGIDTQAGIDSVYEDNSNYVVKASSDAKEHDEKQLLDDYNHLLNTAADWLGAGTLDGYRQNLGLAPDAFLEYMLAYIEESNAEGLYDLDCGTTKVIREGSCWFFTELADNGTSKSVRRVVVVDNPKDRELYATVYADVASAFLSLTFYKSVGWKPMEKIVEVPGIAGTVDYLPKSQAQELLDTDDDEGGIIFRGDEEFGVTSLYVSYNEIPEHDVIQSGKADKIPALTAKYKLLKAKNRLAEAAAVKTELDALLLKRAEVDALHRQYMYLRSQYILANNRYNDGFIAASTVKKLYDEAVSALKKYRDAKNN